MQNKRQLPAATKPAAGFASRGASLPVGLPVGLPVAPTIFDRPNTMAGRLGPAAHLPSRGGGAMPGGAGHRRAVGSSWAMPALPLRPKKLKEG